MNRLQQAEHDIKAKREAGAAPQPTAKKKKKKVAKKKTASSE